MRWSLTLSTAILVTIPVFSTPIPRFILGKRGLFEQTLSSTGTTPISLAVMVANALTSDPQPCAHVKAFFQQLAAGEAEPGVTTIGDRAVTGARKMLGLAGTGATGLIQMVNDVKDVNMSNATKTALVQTLSNSARTIASLKTYKFLLDTQASLDNLTSNAKQFTAVTDLVTQIQPIMTSLENVIDQFGADFSVQKVTNQTTDLQNMLALVSDGTTNVQNLKNLNTQNQESVTALMDVALNNMNLLAAAAQEASALASQPPDIPPEQFNFQIGTACTA